MGRPVTVVEFFESWPERFPRHPRTTDSNVARIRVYVLPYLPRKGEFPENDSATPVKHTVEADA